jgi:putative toxin-antitoxin system antitoxin component (TIGR02293 family)
MTNSLNDGESDAAESARLESPAEVYRVSGQPTLMDAVDHWLEALRNLGFKAPMGKSSTFKQVREALQEGVPRLAFNQLRTDLGVSNEDLADILGIPTRTLARRTERFKPDESERLLRVGSVWAMALAVLESQSAARRWMTQPKRALGGLTPLRCCDTEIGAREVESLLGRIEHGVFS